MAAALNLLAEAELPDTIGAHRRTGGLIPGAPGTALLSGWMYGDAPQPLGEHEEFFIALPAALVALVGPQGGAMYVDRNDGVICFASVADKQATVGAAMEDQDNWGERVHARAAKLGLTPSSAERQLLLDAATIDRVTMQIAGARSDQPWIQEYGLALGAAMLAASSDPGVRSHVRMTAVAPKIKEHPAMTVARKFSDRKFAVRMMIAGALILLLGPYLFQTLRLQLLTSRTATLDSSRESRELLRKRAALFAQLDNAKTGRLPMTKLLHDVAVVAPVGVAVPNIRISPEQGISLQGTADKDELVNVYQANLTQTKLFSNVKLNRKEKNDKGVDFDISADIVQPHLVVKGEDFAAQTIAVRLYGEGAVNTQAAPSTERRSSDRTRRRDSEQTQGDDSRRPATSEPATPPPPLTDDEIAKMDLATARKEFTTRVAYPQKNRGTDAATKQRLQDEVTKLRAKLSGGGT
jgi:Tfp pilus assembly protein PilN